MAATIKQTDATPLQTVEVEGVTVDIIENALKNARCCSAPPCRRAYGSRETVSR